MTKKEFAEGLDALTRGVPHFVANLANASALLFEQLPDLNWAGFYLMEEGKLVLGPFQGKTACIEIPLSRGVCGAAAREKHTMLVPNVHEFPGHIACDCASNSELVVPIMKDGEVKAVIDLDSPLVGRFTAEDQELVEAAARVLEETTF